MTTELITTAAATERPAQESERAKPLARLEACIKEAGVPRWKKRTVELLLGTDREIGKGDHALEKRVGITPAQVGELRRFCDVLELGLSVLVMRGAGVRAGYADSHYIEAGAEIITREELVYHDGPPDVVHALKEPSAYESEIPGPFCRIGALHAGDFHQGSGIARLLGNRAVMIFDGSSIGAAGTYRIPIRGCMSDFAGRVAGQWTVEHLERHALEGRVLVVGGGRAGTAAARRLLACSNVREIHLFDDARNPERLEEIRAAFAPEHGRVSVLGSSGRDDATFLDSLDGAVGTIFAVARPGARTPKIVHLENVKRLPCRGSIVVDISIDEGGAIMDPNIRQTWTHERIIPHLEDELAEHKYQAIANMPRAHPKVASEVHGEVILPYLATLLVLAGREGGPDGLVEYLLQRSLMADNPGPDEVAQIEVLDALAQDLRNGMAFYSRRLDHDRELPDGARRIVVEDFVPNRRTVFGFLFRQNIPFELSIRPWLEAAGDDGAAKAKAAFELLAAPIRETLDFAVDNAIDGTVIFHPDIDGTRSAAAARALGVEASDVINCMILSRDETSFLAAICEATRKISLARLKELTAASSLRWATPDEIQEITSHPPGGVPVIQVFRMVETVFISETVMEKPFVVGSAGTEFIGLKLEPEVLRRLGGQVAAITR